MSRACTPKCWRFGTQACPTSVVVEIILRTRSTGTDHDLEGGDDTSSDGGREEVDQSPFLFSIQLFIGGEQ